MSLFGETTATLIRQRLERKREGLVKALATIEGINSYVDYLYNGQIKGLDLAIEIVKEYES